MIGCWTMRLRKRRNVAIMNDSHILVSPLEARPNKDTVFTVFRAANFDRNVNKKTDVGITMNF